MRSTLKITLFLLFVTSMLCAQEKASDKLVKRDGDTIVCKVREIGDDEIKYLLDDFRSDVVFGIDKNKVASILFGDGRELVFSDSMFGKDNYNQQRKNAIKMNFFSPLTGATSFSYERSLQPGRSIEGGLGIIGLGQKLEGYKASGFYLNAGYKFIKDPDFYVKGMKYAHILKGSYFKPELAMSVYRYSNRTYMGSNVVSDPDTNVAMFALILNVGKQWVFGDRFLVDWYVGAGYGFGKNDEYDNARHFAFTGGTSSTPLVLNAGFRVGLLF
jgi:hypothetical protein